MQIPNSHPLFHQSLALALLTFAAAGSASAADQASPKPNVIVILTDDQGHGDMSCHGNPYIQTPAIDSLHRDSVRLTDFHVDPTCSPTRAALLTGRYSSRVGVWLTYGSRHHLQRDETTLANAFRDNGYRTAIFGKWHLGDNYPFRPTDRGFDEALIHGGGMIGETPDHWNNDYYDDVYFRNNEPEQVQGYCTDVWFREAREFVRRNRDRPFFLYLPTNAPHGPLHVPEKFVTPLLNNPAIPHSRAHFYGMIACIDENLKQLRADLAALNLDRDTLLVFLNDNGTGHGVTLTNNGKPDRNGWVESTTKTGGFNSGMRGRKASAYEGGHRAACFIHWPGGNINGGKDVSGLTAHLDLMPTLIDLCGLSLPHEIEFDGISLAAVLKQPRQRVPQRTMVVHHQGRFAKPIGDGMPIHGKDFAVMSGPWRLVGSQLFDLRQDPGQHHDIASQHAHKCKQMRQAYEHWWDSVSKNFGKPNAFEIDPNQQATTTISSQNLLGARVAYSQHHVRNAMPIPEAWTWIDVKQSGQYEFVVRRWPREVDCSLSDTTLGHPIDESKHDENNKTMNLPSQAIEVAQVQLQVGDFDRTVRVAQEDQQAVFAVDLTTGLQRLKATLISDDDSETAAYYVYISLRDSH